MSASSSPNGDVPALTARVSDGLERVLAALALGDAEAARAAAQDAEAACAALSARGVRLAPGVATPLAEACARAQKTAAAILGRVGGELSGTARSRRAADAYAGPTSPHRHLP